MSSYKDLEIYQIAFDLAIQIHKASLKLPDFELYEQGSQIRRSSKSIKDNISEGYGRRRYKTEFIRFLILAQASCDETINQLETLVTVYPELSEFKNLIKNLMSWEGRLIILLSMSNPIGNPKPATSNQQPETIRFSAPLSSHHQSAGMIPSSP
jgi:four helix bundle protein